MLLSVAVTATRVPGLKWDALEVWEASALPGAWDDVDGYLDFRTYALDRLSDLGFLDILLDDLRTSAAPVLRVIADCGDYTGMTVLLVGAAAAAASSSGRSSRSKTSTDGAGGDEDEEKDGDGRGFTVAIVKSQAASLLRRLLRRGVVRSLLATVMKVADANPLSFFQLADARVCPVSDQRAR